MICWILEIFSKSGVKKKIIQKIEDDDNTRDLPWEKISYFFLLHKNYKKFKTLVGRKFDPN